MKAPLPVFSPAWPKDGYGVSHFQDGCISFISTPWVQAHRNTHMASHPNSQGMLTSSSLSSSLGPSTSSGGSVLSLWVPVTGNSRLLRSDLRPNKWIHFLQDGSSLSCYFFSLNLCFTQPTCGSKIAPRAPRVRRNPYHWLRQLENNQVWISGNLSTSYRRIPILSLRYMSLDKNANTCGKKNTLICYQACLIWIRGW